VGSVEDRSVSNFFQNNEHSSRKEQRYVVQE
jgi:hypothetical protein